MFNNELWEEVETASKEEIELLEKEKTPFPSAIRSAIWKGIEVAIKHFHIEESKEEK